ncbi:hypothetical protein D918_04384 [Trichuris suis]|nr:hypothetical protein D918_04384 [Trichuris suis]
MITPVVCMASSDDSLSSCTTVYSLFLVELLSTWTRRLLRSACALIYCYPIERLAWLPSRCTSMDLLGLGQELESVIVAALGFFLVGFVIFLLCCIVSSVSLFIRRRKMRAKRTRQQMEEDKSANEFVKLVIPQFQPPPPSSSPNNNEQQPNSV